MSTSADPTVTLSNGLVVDLSTQFQDSLGLSDVQHITYTLHGPVGTTMTGLTYPDATGAISTLSYVADETPGSGGSSHYDAYVVGTTKTPKIAMTTQFKVLTQRVGGGKVPPTQPAAGLSGQTLHSIMID